MSESIEDIEKCCSKFGILQSNKNIYCRKISQKCINDCKQCRSIHCKVWKDNNHEKIESYSRE